jgi:hypothetical protein
MKAKDTHKILALELVWPISREDAHKSTSGHFNRSMSWSIADREHAGQYYRLLVQSALITSYMYGCNVSIKRFIFDTALFHLPLLLRLHHQFSTPSRSNTPSLLIASVKTYASWLGFIRAKRLAYVALFKLHTGHPQDVATGLPKPRLACCHLPTAEYWVSRTKVNSESGTPRRPVNRLRRSSWWGARAGESPSP